MRRRQFIKLLGGAAVAWPTAVHAQQALPLVGFLYSGSPTPMAPYLSVFRQALAQAGYVENKNVAIEYRYAEGQYDRLPLLAADLDRRQAAVIVASPNTNAARAAIAASGGTPIVFNVSDDPVKLRSRRQPQSPRRQRHRRELFYERSGGEATRPIA